LNIQVEKGDEYINIKLHLYLSV